MEQRALNALEPFLALSKSATSPLAAVDLVVRATSAPNTFIFTELLITPQIQALRTLSEHLPYLQLLSIFCYGTYGEYVATPNLPAVNDTQMHKLRQLSLVTLSQDPKNLTYTNLMTSLGLHDVRALENLVISTIYASLITATLDPYNQRVCVSSVASLRDVSPAWIPSMISTLHDWSGRCTSTLSSLEKQILTIKNEAAQRYKEQREWDVYVENMVENDGVGAAKDAVKKSVAKGENKRGFKGFGNGTVDSGDMDVDEDEDEDMVEGKSSNLRSSKKRGLGQ